ncbi:MAG: family N-acetyltransferase [Ferruginibacter sp.]|uniref:GNAT family N-acetyltransferase n=1 Tax=Ferruginibacter sp. TaxID=1940288 RepID=UPI00265B2112|nr:GNAT family protein [Ferruginibacter sp.]MDB5278146.1 family N-acetyltransferase [Ferruginibacter sp.]
MSSWINYPTILQGQTVNLIPLEEMHFPVLEQLAKDERIWQFYPFDGTDSSRILSVLTTALAERNVETRFPFVIVHKAENKIIGSTSLLDLQPKNLKLEIGSTWLHPDYWATPVNLECKLLLLTHCFEKLNTVRVQLKTDENNVRSRKAIEKIGGQLEGIFRNDMLRDNNTRRNSAYYSIIQEEWPEKKIKLAELYYLRQ